MRSGLAEDTIEDDRVWRALRRDILHARLMLEALKGTYYRVLHHKRAMGLTSLRDERWMRTFERSAAFNPMQPRVPAGNPDGGEWTSGDGGGKPILIGDGRGLPVNLLEEEANGGHTIERHVAKPESYLKARITGSRTNIPYIGGEGEKRAGSFTSLDAANKLVNATISANQAKVDAWLSGSWLYPPFGSIYITTPAGYFTRPTGYEAYAPDVTP